MGFVRPRLLFKTVAKWTFSPRHNREIFPGPAQAISNVQKRRDSDHLISSLDERLRSQGPRAAAEAEQNIGAKHHLSNCSNQEFFPGSAQTVFEAQKREDSELLDDRLRSQGSLHMTSIPKITGMGGRNTRGLTPVKASTSQNPDSDSDEWLIGLLDDPLRSQGPRATEATAQNSSDMDDFAPCHDREMSPVPRKPILTFRSVGKTDILFLSWTSV